MNERMSIKMNVKMKEKGNYGMKIDKKGMLKK